MNRYLQQLIVGIAGAVGGFIGLIGGAWLTAYILSGTMLGLFGGMIGIAVGFITGPLVAARCGEIMGRFLERYD